MSARRQELTRIAARLFAERGYQGTSLADLAAQLGVQKPSLYHHIASKEDLLWDVAWEGAEAFHAALDGVPAAAPPAERIRLALRAHLAVVAAPPSSTSPRCSCANGATSRGNGANGSSPSGGAMRSASATSSATASKGANCAPISMSRRRPCSSSRPPTGPTPGSVPTPTRTGSPTGSSRRCSTACADTRRPADRLVSQRRVLDTTISG